MNKQQQIEEMAKDIENTILGLGFYLCHKSAEKLLNLGYRKIPEDSVVLSRKEYEKLKYTWITDSDAYKKGCKETAEKILNETMHIPVIEGKFVKVDDLIDKLKGIATREGIEIKE